MKLDLDRYVPGLLTWITNKITSSANQMYHDRFDIGVTDWRVLSYFEIFPWSTAAQACQLMGIDKAAVSRSVNVLFERKLIKSRPNGLRKIEHATTALGKALHANVYRVAMARQEALLTDFSEDERELLIKFLHRLLGNLGAAAAVGRETNG